MLTAYRCSNHDCAHGLRSPAADKVKPMNDGRIFRGVLAALAVCGAVILGGCGEDNVNDARDDIQRQAEDFTQGIPDQAQDAQEQAEGAAQDVQDQIDALEGGN